MTSLTSSGPIPLASSPNVALIGGSLATPVDRTAFRYRITWRFVAAPFVPNATIDTYEVAEALRDCLPANGMVAVSPIAVLPGDPFIQFTTQLTSSFQGYTLADVVNYANKLPLFPVPSAGTSLRLALEVSEVEVRASNLSSQIVLAQDTVSRQRAIDGANEAEIQNKVVEAVKDVGSFVGDIGKLLLGLVGIIAVTYIIVRYRR